VSRASEIGLALFILAASAWPATAAEWSYGASAFVFDPPNDDAFLSPILEADRGVLHFEGRYNYEDQETGSVFAGRIFRFGEKVEWTVVPIMGLVLGRTDGVAPGVKLDVGWQKLTLSTESEAVIDFEDAGASFVYTWLEGTIAASDWLSLGLVGQRTKTYETGLEFQRGPMVQASRGPGWLAFYWFNLDRPDDETFVFAGGWEF